jgi:hypothetical protein
MVQRSDSSDAILDATVNLTFTAPTSSVVEPAEQVCSPSEAVSHSSQFTVPATRQQASNKLLYAARVTLDAVGNWRLQALVESGSDRVKIGCDIPVGSSRGRLASLLPCLILPPLLVALFAVNQGLRLRPATLLQSTPLGPAQNRTFSEVP